MIYIGATPASIAPGMKIYRGSNLIFGGGAIAIIQIGQSNNVGRADADGNAVVVPEGVYEYRPGTNSVQVLADPTGEGAHAATSASMNPNLGKRVKELTGRDVYIIPVSLGNTNSYDWLPGLVGGYFGDALTDYNNFVAYCAANEITISHVFAHFLQGENDAGKINGEEYYYRLSKIVTGMVDSMNSTKALITRIGYDPVYSSAAGSEDIMKAQKIAGLLNSNVVVTTNQTATFTTANSKMKADGVHYTLLGLNEVAEAVAQNINSIISSGNGVALPSEPVVALQGISGNSAELNRFAQFNDEAAKDWLFNFASNINEANGDVSPYNLDKTAYPGNRTVIPVAPTFDADGIVMDKSSAIKLSVPFVSSGDFDIEFRYKAAATPSWTAMMGDDGLSGGYANKIQLDYSGNNLNDVYIGSATASIYWQGIATDAVTSFVTVRFVRVSGNVTLYINGVQFGATQALAGTVTFQWIGAGASNAAYDFSGTLDFIHLIKP